MFTGVVRFRPYLGNQHRVPLFCVFKAIAEDLFVTLGPAAAQTHHVPGTGLPWPCPDLKSRGKRRASLEQPLFCYVGSSLSEGLIARLWEQRSEGVRQARHEQGRPLFQLLWGAGAHGGWALSCLFCLLGSEGNERNLET